MKLGIKKQLVKALPTEVDRFKYQILAYPGLSIEKIKTGMFDDPQIWQLIKNEYSSRQW